MSSRICCTGLDWNVTRRHSAAVHNKFELSNDLECGAEKKGEKNANGSVYWREKTSRQAMVSNETSPRYNDPSTATSRVNLFFGCGNAGGGQR